MTAFNPFGEEIEYNTSETSEETIHDGGGGRVDKEGYYHVNCFEVTYQPGEPATEVDGERIDAKLPKAIVKLKVLNGTEVSEIGKSIYHTLYLANWEDKPTGQMKPLEGTGLAGLLGFCYAFGTVDGSIFGKQSIKLELGMIERLENLTAIVKIQLEKATRKTINPKTGKPYEPRHQICWNSDAWPVGHVKVEDVPTDPDGPQYQKSGEASVDDYGGL
jgi:hypothetical protein